MHAAATAQDGPTSVQATSLVKQIAAVGGISAIRLSFKVRKIPIDTSEDFEVVKAKQNEVLQARTAEERAVIERAIAERRVYLGTGVGLENLPTALAEHGFVLAGALCVTRLVRELWADELEDPDNYDPAEIHRFNFQFRREFTPKDAEQAQYLADDGEQMLRHFCEEALWRADVTQNPLKEGGTGWAFNLNHRAQFILSDGAAAGAYKRGQDGQKFTLVGEGERKRKVMNEFVPLAAERFLRIDDGALTELLNV